MGLLDHFAEDQQPAQDWSLAEEAAQYAPALWAPAHVKPEGISGPLPADFPVLDPFPANPRIEHFKRIMHEHAECKREACPLDDREALAYSVGEEVAEAIGDLRKVVVVLWAHGETLMAVRLAEQIDTLLYETVKPFLESAGITAEDDSDYED